MSIKISSIQGISTMSANPINRWLRTNPDISNRNPLWDFYTFQGTVAGYASGGGANATRYNIIDKFPFATNANATDIGDLTVSRSSCRGQSSQFSGYTSGGSITASPFYSNVIDKFPFATDANATDVGDLTVARDHAAGQSSIESGYTSGGIDPGFPNVIDKFPFATDANATDVGDLTVARGGSGQSSTVSGYTSGGQRASQPSPPIPFNILNVIDKFPFATDANATDVGDLSRLYGDQAGQSSDVNGYTSGGYTRASPGLPLPTNPTVLSNNIEKFPFATNSNATNVADLSQSRADGAGQSSNASGYTSGGQTASVPTTVYVNTIDKFPFATDTSATDVGDLTVVRSSAAGQQN